MRKKNKKNIIPAEYQKNCIIYVRMSDEYKQNETSIDAQVRECREFAEKQGLRVVNILQDKYSGTVADRAGFEEMKRLARAKPICKKSAGHLCSYGLLWFLRHKYCFGKGTGWP